MKAIQEALYEEYFEHIRASGNRLTEARKEIIEALDTAREPKTILEIAGHVKADETSVYRALELFVELGIAEEIVVGNSRRFALAHEHHHHIVCDSCGHIAHIPCDAKNKISHPRHKEFKSVTSHQVTYYGLCTQCTK